MGGKRWKNRNWRERANWGGAPKEEGRWRKRREVNMYAERIELERKTTLAHDLDKRLA